MRIILAQPRGFCAGVVRAVDIVEKALSKYGNPIYVRRQIVHNKHVIKTLASKGVFFVEELSEVPPQAVAIFSAHGVGRDVEVEARERNLHVFDGTCPLVKKVHDQGRRYVSKGYTLILIGHSGHPEVVGTIGQINAQITLIQRESDVENLSFPSECPLAYITQTTLSVDDTRNIIDALKKRYPKIVGPDVGDICYATQNRQMAVRELSSMVDVILIVGAKNSSNSLRLQEVAEESGVRCYLVEDGEEVDREWLIGADAVGLTASASAPEVVVQDVIHSLSRMVDVELSIMSGPVEQVQFQLPDELAENGK
ncbi:4-hydroxy-3-methylbut-2-enyl diphosphate reductase [Burkholderia cenocepacia]|uniref:4-hydroxy-3-methylbut-2-enyl diphosphate reductase n=1 Tax=Burkholderia cenocepacia TaxID=95486 RepID=UPI0023B89745|nr:4-hydroxy-3-methylbut-2-enyl diphosphate reductase [Burkholderia cenocepacia]MDF0506472.1 4-hydroxy-3-methylbut-2-enyl diphosphate reductase [Burkholderia cenocepacia]